MTGILTRVRQLLSANINAMIDSAEDPEKMADEYLRELQQQLDEARGAVASAMADEKSLSMERDRYMSQVTDWRTKAEIAVTRGDDALAKEALMRKGNAQKLADSYSQQYEEQHGQVEELRQALVQLEQRVRETEARRDLIRAKNARAQSQEAIGRALESTRSAPPSSEGLDRLEREVDNRLNKASAMAELQGQDLDTRFSNLEAEQQADQELAEIKQKLGKQ